MPTHMFKKAFDSIKATFGHKRRKQAAFDDAMLLILKAIADSRLRLTTQKPEQSHADKGKELAHAWSEAAVKVNRLNDELREQCLALAKTFSDAKHQEAEHARAAVDQVEAIFTKASVFLGEAGQQPVVAAKPDEGSPRSVKL